VVQGSAEGSLFQVGLAAMRKHFLGAAAATRNLVSGVLSLVAAERGGETADRALLKSVVQMLHALGLYRSELEERLLEATRGFYRSQATALVQEAGTAQYLLHCEGRLEEEAGRCCAYLQPGTLAPLVRVAEEELLSEAHVAKVLGPGFAALVDGAQHADLRRMHQLLLRVGREGDLRAALQAHVRQRVGACVSDPEQDRKMISSLLQLKASVDAAVAEAFGGDPAFVKCVRDAFESGINSRQNRPAELLAKHIDARMRGGGKGKTEDDLEAEFDQLIVLFRFISGKDVFEAFYKKDLAKRLLLSRSTSVDAEKGMIAKLKAECGAPFTSKLEGMFKDINVSKDVMASFRGSAAHQDRLQDGLEMSVNVLTKGFWPTYPTLPVTLPPQLQHHQEVFKEFYLSKHNGRRLHWHDSLGQCVVRCEFPLGRKELVTSLFQAVVLLLFNDAERLTVEELAKATSLEARELQRTLLSLTTKKFPILLVERAGAAAAPDQGGSGEGHGEEGQGDKAKPAELGGEDVLVFNKGFKEKLYRIKVNNVVQLKETSEEQQQCTDRVMQDRQYQVDAAIVRVMKTRKVLSHVLLANELVQQLRFTIRPADLKKRIESLIERDYLERDASKPNMYHYVA